MLRYKPVMPGNRTGNYYEYFEIPEIPQYTYVLTWIIPLLFAMAIFGNTLIVIVMHMPKNRRLASSTFFTALAVSDTFLVCQVSMERWLDRGLDIAPYSSWKPNMVAKLKTIATYSNWQISTWILVSVTIERAISVAIPLKVKLFCTNANARIAVAVICVFTIALNTLEFFVLFNVFYVKRLGPISIPKFPGASDIFVWVDIVYGFLVPFLIMLTGTILIVTKLHHNSLEKTAAVLTPRGKSISKIIVIANIVFCLTIIPYRVVSILEARLGYKQYLHRLFDPFLFMTDANAALNFFLYVLSGSRFRKDVMELFCKKRRHSSSKDSSSAEPATPTTKHIDLHTHDMFV